MIGVPAHIRAVGMPIVDPLAAGLFVWGQNFVGELGLGYYGSFPLVTSPVQVGSERDWRIFTEFNNTGSGIRGFVPGSGGRLYRWGSPGPVAPYPGAIGDGTLNFYNSPVQIGAETDWENVFGASGQSRYVASAGGIRGGRLFMWGENGAGQLGLGNRVDRSSPVQVGAATDWTAGVVSDVLLALRGGALFACGNNNFGQLGIGNTSRRSSPVQVGSATDWTSVAVNIWGTSFGIRAGQLYSWGSGSLGTGTSGVRSSPVQVGSETDWTAISVGGDQVIALRGGMLFAWGSNSFGELGLGDATPRSSPVQVGSETDWTSISAGGQMASYGIRSGKLFAWGYGGNYQLGLGEAHGTISYSSPVQVGSETDWKFVKSGSGAAFALR